MGSGGGFVAGDRRDLFPGDQRCAPVDSDPDPGDGPDQANRLVNVLDEGADEPYAGGIPHLLHGAVRCGGQAVADQLPPYVQAEEPTLEDAYLYLISREAAQ